MKEKIELMGRRIWFACRLARSLLLLLVDEYRRGTLIENLRSVAGDRSLNLARDMSHAELLEEKAERFKERRFLYFEDEVFSFAEMNRNANRVANYLLEKGGGKGRGLAIVMKNSPRWLDVFFGLEKIGMYAVPVNAALRGDQLAHVLENSQCDMVVIDEDMLEYYLAIEGGLERTPRVIVNRTTQREGSRIPPEMGLLDEAYGARFSAKKPQAGYDPDDLCVLMYTSGTTGLPKGVVYRYGATKVKAISLLSRVFLGKEDVAYTCYPLFHANALFLTVVPALHAGCKLVVSRKFSASRFWDEMRSYGVTTFNGIGSVLPILMKQPEKRNDCDNYVRLIVSAGCPAEIWADFERRFGVRIFEGYGAVDGGGVVITNFGTAPRGSMGKPFGATCRVIDESGNDVPPGTVGELVCEVGDGGGSVEYYRNREATREKVKDGWLYTGDLVYADDKGYLYFVGRNTDSMRCGGENVSAYEVESAVMKHPDVLECAAYAVPSELAEDEIMVTLVPLEGRSLEPGELADFLSDKLAKYAIPRYLRIVDELPKTETHRVIKKELKETGVTTDTYDRKEKLKR